MVMVTTNILVNLDQMASDSPKSMVILDLQILAVKQLKANMATDINRTVGVTTGR